MNFSGCGSTPSAPARTSAKYEVNAYPMLVFVDATGKELSRARGYHNGDAFTKDLTGVLNAVRAAELTKAVAAAPKDAATLSRLSVFYSGQGQLDDAKTYLDRAAAQDPNRQSEAVLAAYRALSAAYYQNKDWAAAIPIFEEQVRRGHETHETILSQLMLGISYLKNNEKSKAIAVAQSIKNNAQATQEEKQVADQLIAAAK